MRRFARLPKLSARPMPRSQARPAIAGCPPPRESPHVLVGMRLVHTTVSLPRCWSWERKGARGDVGYGLLSGRTREIVAGAHGGDWAAPAKAPCLLRAKQEGWATQISAFY